MGPPKPAARTCLAAFSVKCLEQPSQTWGHDVETCEAKQSNICRFNDFSCKAAVVMGMSPWNMDDADFDQLTFEIQLLIIGNSIYLHQYIHGLISTPKTLGSLPKFFQEALPWTQWLSKLLSRPTALIHNIINKYKTN